MASELAGRLRVLLGLTALHGLHLLAGAVLLLTVPLATPAALVGALAVAALTYPAALALLRPVALPLSPPGAALAFAASALPSAALGAALTWALLVAASCAAGGAGCLG